ncbi:MAG TPA: glycoside hydrolase family 3 N-terminal domain-containing protein [Candidatus Saccharimonadales bacterium]|jgi:beta-N-acetylhexosaminidase|nr:glycoside hydrolase family 3 N-terminal domain-containing protein [Candidatus Saccharimonadales bacterium]
MKTKVLAASAIVLALLAYGAFHNRGKSPLPWPRPDAPPAESLIDHLGQTFIVGIPGPSLDARSEQLLRYIRPGGIVLYYRNFVSGEQLQTLILKLQALARETTGRPYLVMIDEEPGGAGRLGLFRHVFATGVPNWAQIDHDIGVMERLGINVELAPLADFPFNHQSFIRRRIPAHSVEALTEFNHQFVVLLKKHGISATLKHFPGMGTFADDPHKTLPQNTFAARDLDSSLKIFQQGIDAGAELVMTGHAVYSGVDPRHPATLSKEIVTGLLRRQLGFRGLVITDDLSDMPFITGQDLSLDEAAEQALEAGHTMVLFSHKLAKTRKIFDLLLERAGKDEALRSVIEINYGQIAAFKDRQSHRQLVADVIHSEARRTHQ